MKFLSTTALGLALAFGAVAITGVAAPAVAAKPKAPSLKISDPVRKLVAGAQEAMKKNDVAGARGLVDQAKAVASTPDDKYVVSSQLYEVGKALNDQKAQAEAIAGMLDSGKVPEENQGPFNMALGQLSYMTQDYARAEVALQNALNLKVNDPVIFALLAETKFRLKKGPEAVQLIQSAADAGEAAGKPIPQEWFARGIAIGSDAKLADQVAKLSLSWLKAYPSQTHWRDSLLIYRDLRTLDADFNLDLMRLQRAAGALRGERDYAELAEATYIKFPGEAKSIVDKGVADGALNLAQSRGIKELADIAATKIAADKASLSKNANNGKLALGTADAYASYGDYASAIEMYRKALTLGGVDANVVNTRLGAALAQSGQKEEAKKVFATLTGPRADLGRFWTVLMDAPPAS